MNEGNENYANGRHHLYYKEFTEGPKIEDKR
jgi:hypothetical protein